MEFYYLLNVACHMYLNNLPTVAWVSFIVALPQPGNSYWMIRQTGPRMDATLATFSDTEALLEHDDT